MRRMTITLPDELAIAIDRERRRQDTSASAIVRIALDTYFVSDQQEAIQSIFNLGKTGTGESVGARTEEILAAEYADYLQRENGISVWPPPADPDQDVDASEPGR